MNANCCHDVTDVPDWLVVPFLLVMLFVMFAMGCMIFSMAACTFGDAWRDWLGDAYQNWKDRKQK